MKKLLFALALSAQLARAQTNVDTKSYLWTNWVAETNLTFMAKITKPYAFSFILPNGEKTLDLVPLQTAQVEASWAATNWVIHVTNEPVITRSNGGNWFITFKP